MNSALTIAQGEQPAADDSDRNNLPRDWGLSALNVTAQSSISATYELPFGKNPRLHPRLIGGWQLNGIATILSGFPLTPQVGYQSFRRRRHQEPGPAFFEPRVYRDR